jgi:polysaccharide export outer membrane protein
MTMLLLLLALQAAQPPSPTVTPVTAALADYNIGVADIIDVVVFGEPDASRTGVTVDNDGTIDCPYIGRVKVAGQTARQVEKLIRDRLAEKVLVNPTVSVTIVKYRSKTVTVQGQVRNPSEYILQGNVSLTSVLAQAGSMTLDAGSYVIISRIGANGQPEQIKVTRKDIESGKAQTVFLKDGDTVLVPKAETFFVTGLVRTPNAYTWEEGLTVERAITLAGGPTERAGLGRTEIERIVDGKSKTIKAKMNDVVQPNDTIRVKQRIW